MQVHIILNTLFNLNDNQQAAKQNLTSITHITFITSEKITYISN